MFLILLFTLPILIFAWSPTGGYAPGEVFCPTNINFLRSSNGLLSDEIDYINNRQRLTTPALTQFVKRSDRIDFDVASIVSNSNIKIGLAFSGGGFRAMLVGGGEFAALDSRTKGSTERGHLGGLLQASSYISGLSGGSWLLTSIYMQNFTTIDSLISDPILWNLSNFLTNDQILNRNFLEPALLDPLSKLRAGFKISITDIWGRILSREFIKLPNGGPNLEWSDMINWQWFQDNKAPYPIFLANDRMPIENLASINASIYEITPYEIGSFDPQVCAFTPLKYLGTKLNNGVPQSKCISGFDNTGFLFGTSSSVFDLVIHNLLERLGSRLGILKTFINSLLQSVTADVGIYSPNPFYGNLIPAGFSSVSNSEDLYLVDGGENGIVVPFQPLVHPDRKIDIIFAFDTNVDTPYGWPNGSSIIKQYQRQFNVKQTVGNPVTFPYVPEYNTFINSGLINKPTFFGCDGNNLTSLGSNIPPLVVYLPNNPYSYWSNTSVLKLNYDTKDTLGLINNGYNIVTQLNGTRDPNWQSCVTCAIVQRELERRNLDTSPFCMQCFDKYCWNGAINDVTPQSSAKEFNPSLLSQPIY